MNPFYLVSPSNFARECNGSSLGLYEGIHALPLPQQLL
jgi:hypothetical protein